MKIRINIQNNSRSFLKILLFGFIFSSSAVAVVLALKIFEVKTVYIAARPETFNQTNFFNKKINLLFLSTTKLAKELKQNYPVIADIKFRKQFPNSLTIYVLERDPIAMVRSQESLDFVDYDGWILSVREVVQNEYILINCEPKKSEGKVTSAEVLISLKIIRMLQRDEPKIKIITCDYSQKLINLEFERFSVFVNNESDPQIVVSSLHYLQKQFRIEGATPKVIDLRYDKPVLIP